MKTRLLSAKERGSRYKFKLPKRSQCPQADLEQNNAGVENDRPETSSTDLKNSEDFRASLGGANPTVLLVAFPPETIAHAKEVLEALCCEPRIRVLTCSEKCLQEPCGAFFSSPDAACNEEACTAPYVPPLCLPPTIVFFELVDWGRLEVIEEAMYCGDLLPACLCPLTAQGAAVSPSATILDLVQEAVSEYDNAWSLRTPLETVATEWEPDEAQVSLNLMLDGALVTAGGGQTSAENWDCSSLVVLDNFFGEDQRSSLYDLITEDDWGNQETPPPGKWDRSTVDLDGLPGSWGLSDAALEALVNDRHPAILEVQSRISKVYPEMTIMRMPEVVLEGCAPMVANAAVDGDCFQWHVDMDPLQVYDSPWTVRHGHYLNRTAGKPLFVSLLLYLNDEWPLQWDGETMFLDERTGTGVFVRPQPYRAVLMDQDISHRLSTPSVLANRPRYSLVWKLVFFPKAPGQKCSLSRPQWGEATRFGSASQQPLTDH
ncbi:hypothetical protein CYMTET_19455 [Cymbomonas tetramitiformis]|uniref:Fe2OG dioxygenase domain-containing protein n=1 Tax=Cymbomonas tetramitiformis TaxID=36881 RepID=A0AAE0L4Y3_9CHLO|nr:hypothetical protein CYMTET_19455 [Cymbomonas tetramitiformis]